MGMGKNANIAVSKGNTMSKSINILDKDYIQWIKELSSRYRRSQIKAAVKVNEEMLRFYWELGRDIVEKKAESRWGSGFMKNLSYDLKAANPDATCFSQTNLLYMKNFYLLFPPQTEIAPQVGEQLEPANKITPQVGEQNKTVRVEQAGTPLFMIPWGHYKLLIDKFKKKMSHKEAWFYVTKTIENDWSRDMLLNVIDSDLYHREGKALSNFCSTLPKELGSLAQELTKDPYNFAFTGITGRYNERLLKDALLNNITQFMVELGTGFAYVGKEYRIQVGEREQFMDLLFYNLNLSCYVVVEVKIGKFEFADVGQLGGYVVSCNHILRKEGRDNPTIGLLICKEKDRIQAQYALESSSQPLGISEYELEKFYPEKIEGTIPTIKEIEEKLKDFPG